MNGYLLDTDHCIKLLEGHPSVVARLTSASDVPVASCVIVEGELRYAALRSKRSADNLARPDALLRELTIYAADRESARIYAELKSKILLHHFVPRDRRRRQSFRVETLGFKDNDLWIAAVALRRGLTLVSADRDFARMAEAANLTIEQWWTR